MKRSSLSPRDKQMKDQKERKSTSKLKFPDLAEMILADYLAWLEAPSPESDDPFTVVPDDWNPDTNLEVNRQEFDMACLAYNDKGKFINTPSAHAGWVYASTFICPVNYF